MARAGNALAGRLRGWLDGARLAAPGSRCPVTSFLTAQAGGPDIGLILLAATFLPFAAVTFAAQRLWPPGPGRVRERERWREHTARRARALVRGWAA
jgi:hypothetical protein